MYCVVVVACIYTYLKMKMKKKRLNYIQNSFKKWSQQLIKWSNHLISRTTWNFINKSFTKNIIQDLLQKEGSK